MEFGGEKSLPLNTVNSFTFREKFITEKIVAKYATDQKTFH
jgi:hypothetical protein